MILVIEIKTDDDEKEKLSKARNKGKEKKVNKEGYNIAKEKRNLRTK